MCSIHCLKHLNSIYNFNSVEIGIFDVATPVASNQLTQNWKSSAFIATILYNRPIYS